MSKATKRRMGGTAFERVSQSDVYLYGRWALLIQYLNDSLLSEPMFRDRPILYTIVGRHVFLFIQQHLARIVDIQNFGSRRSIKPMTQTQPI